MDFYITKVCGTRFVGCYSLKRIRADVSSGRLKATWFATESDGRSFSDFSKSEAGNWRTLGELLEEIESEEIETPRADSRFASTGSSTNPALGFLAMCYRLAAVLWGLAAMLGVVVAVNSNEILASVIILWSFSGVIGVITMLATAEGIELFIDMAGDLRTIRRRLVPQDQ